MLSFLLLVFVIELLESSLQFLQLLYFYNHEYQVSMIFGLVFLFLLQVVFFVSFGSPRTSLHKTL